MATIDDRGVVGDIPGDDKPWHHAESGYPSEALPSPTELRVIQTRTVRSQVGDIILQARASMKVMNYYVLTL